MTEEEEIVRKGYDTIASKYQADRHVFKNRRELERFASLLPKNAKVLDVGCGSGIPVTRFLVESGFDVVGVDFSQSMLSLARRNVPEVKLVKKDMNVLGFREKTFDGLTAAYSIIHVPREKHFSLLQSFHRILNPRGIMLASTGPDEWEGVDEYYGTNMFWSHCSPEKSLQLVVDAGFQVMWSKHVRSGGENHYWILARNKN